MTDNGGNPITSLGRTNFKILDDGVPQTVTNFGTSEAPLTVCMLVEFANRYWGFLYLALEYAYRFVDFVKPNSPAAMSGLEFDDWIREVDGKEVKTYADAVAALAAIEADKARTDFVLLTSRGGETAVRRVKLQ